MHCAFTPSKLSSHFIKQTIVRQYATSSSLKKYYAVKVGRKTGVYTTWEECSEQVTRYQNAQYKSFPSMSEAEQFLNPTTSTQQPTITPTITPIKKEKKTRTTTSTTTLAEDETDERRRKQELHQSDLSLTLFNYTQVYTDGSCFGNGSDGAIAGIGIYFGENDHRNVSLKYEDPLITVTNQRAEVKAVIICLTSCVSDDEHVHILTDSMYLINSMTEWRWQWEKNGWRSYTSQPIQNKDLFVELCRIIDGRTGGVRFTYVPSHCGIVGNEEADRLAKLVHQV